MNTNKMSAVLQANKLWTILAMMDYHVEMTIPKDNLWVKEILVTVFYETKDEKTEDKVLEIMRHNWTEGDTIETKEFKDFKTITYTTKWYNIKEQKRQSI